jgi:hypothetical protein
MLAMALSLAMILEKPQQQIQWQNGVGSIDSVRFDSTKVSPWGKIRGQTFMWCVKAGAHPRQLSLLSGAEGGDGISIVGGRYTVEVNTFPAIGAAYVRTFKP